MSQVDIGNIDLEAQDSQVAALNEEVDLIKEDNVDIYWQNCNSDCRLISILFHTSNFLFQLKGIFDPLENSNQQVVNIVYMVFT